MSDDLVERRRLLRYLMLAVFVWGSILALGTTLFGYDPESGSVRFAPNIIRGLIVEGCVLLFIGAWAWLARARNR